MSKVAILGLGAMGCHMARNLLQAGHQVTVYNRTAARAQALVDDGATFAATPRKAAEDADMVIAMVTDDDASRSVWLDETSGALASLRQGAIAIESSTLTTAWVGELAAAIADQGANFLDAPVAGSRPQAEAGALIYLVGGAAETLAAARPVLAVLGGAIHHAGPLGAGMAMKLAVNAFFGIQVAALGEALGLLSKQNIEKEKAVEILGDLPVTAPALKGIGALMAAGNFAPLFPIDLVAKDFGYVIESAARVNADVPVSSAVRDLYARAQSEGYGGDNIAGVAKMFE